MSIVWFVSEIILILVTFVEMIALETRNSRIVDHILAVIWMKNIDFVQYSEMEH